MKYLTQQEARDLREELFKRFNSGVAPGLQLLELSGLSAAQCIYKLYPQGSDLLVIVGPGNNGGNGLVLARQLHFFGHRPVIYYPKRTHEFQHLVAQCKSAQIDFVDQLPSESELNSFTYIVDAIFGINFAAGEIKLPFDSIIKVLKNVKPPIVSIDIPAGWDVEKGNAQGLGFHPAVLVSIGVPKLCAKEFSGPHYLCGRFIPKNFTLKGKELNLPQFPGCDQFVELKPNVEVLR